MHRPQGPHRRLVQLGAGAAGDRDDAAGSCRSACLIALGLVGFAALAMWQLNRLGLLLAGASARPKARATRTSLTGLPNHRHLFELFDQAMATRKGDETSGICCHRSRRLRRGERCARLRRWRRGAGRDRQTAARDACRGRGDRAPRQRRVRPAACPTWPPRLRCRPRDAVRQALARPIWINQVVQVGASIGLAIAPQDGTARDELTRRADLALRRPSGAAAEAQLRLRPRWRRRSRNGAS